MQKIKIIQVLKTFTYAELNEFGKFLNSPFHNESLKMVRLFNYLRKFYPDFNSELLSKELIFRKMYGDAEFSDKKLRERYSDMLSLAEVYLAIVNLKKVPAEYKRHTLFEYNLRRLPVHFEKVNKDINRIIESSEVKDIDYLTNMYNNKSDRSDFYQHTELLGKRKPLYDDFKREVNLFTEVFAAQMLSNFAIMYNWKHQLNYEFDYVFYEPIMKYTEESGMLKYPFVKAYYLIMKIAQDPGDDTRFFQLKDTYINNLDLFHIDDKRRIGTILFNEANWRSSKVLDFRKETFNIMKLQLEQNIYPSEDGWMSREQYLNYVIIPVALGEINWAEEFVKNYTDMVEPQKRENAVKYAKSLLCFERKDYEKALELLATIRQGDYIYYVRIKVMHLKIFFEKKEYDKVLDIMDSFRHYLNGNTAIIPVYIMKRYIRFINAFNKLVYITLKPDSYKLERFKAELGKSSAEKMTLNLTWLIHKAGELKA